MGFCCLKFNTDPYHAAASVHMTTKLIDMSAKYKVLSHTGVKNVFLRKKQAKIIKHLSCELKEDAELATGTYSLNSTFALHSAHVKQLIDAYCTLYDHHKSEHY